MSFITQKLNGNNKIQKKFKSIKKTCILITIALFLVFLVFHYFMSKEIVTYIRGTNAQIEKHTIFPSKQLHNKGDI